MVVVMVVVVVVLKQLDFCPSLHWPASTHTHALSAYGQHTRIVCTCAAKPCPPATLTSFRRSFCRARILKRALPSFLT